MMKEHCAHGEYYSGHRGWRACLWVPENTAEWTTAVVLLLLLIYVIREYAVPYYKGLKRVPEASVWPFVGDTARVFGDGEKLTIERFQQHGPVFTTWILGKRTTFVGSLDMMKMLLNMEHDLVEGDWPTSTKLMLGKGSVSVVTGDFHVRLRKLLKPAFSMSGVANMMPKLAAISEQCLSKWADEGQIKGMLATKEFTFRVILELVFGMGPDRLTPELLERCHKAFVMWDANLFSFPVNLPGFGFHQGMKARKVLADIVKDNIQHIREHVSRRDGDASSASSTLAEDLYLEFDKEENPLTLDDMADTFINLLFAGHDTTAHTIARLLSELPRHPDIWERLSKEQTAVIKEHGAAFSLASLKAMTYLEAVMKETQRRYPIVGGVFRKALRSFELPGRYHIPKGRLMFLSLGHALKYDTRWAGDTGKLAPDQFNPERWLSEEGQKTGAFLPFGSGMRMCVGYLLAQAEMKVFMAVLVRGYAYTPKDVQEPWTTWPVGGYPVNGMPLHLERL